VHRAHVRLILRDFTDVTKNGLHSVRTTTFTSYESNAPFSPDFFKFSIPPGAVEAKLLFSPHLKQRIHLGSISGASFAPKGAFALRGDGPAPPSTRVTSKNSNRKSPASHHLWSQLGSLFGHKADQIERQTPKEISVLKRNKPRLFM